MPYRRDIAVDTLLNVMAGLRTSWAGLKPELRDALSKIIDDGGHDLYQQNPINRATACVRMLDKIAALPGLPPTVTKALADGAGISTVISVTVSDQRRDQALAALCLVYDARRYSDPWSLAETLHQRISQAKGQFDPATRKRWEELDAAGGDPAHYLDELGRLLGDKLPFVREALEAGKTWERVHLSAAIRPPVAKDSLPKTGGGADSATGSPFESLPGPAVPSREVPTAGGVRPGPAAAVAVERTANVYFPDRLQLTQKRTPLIVHVAQQASEATVEVKDGWATFTLFVGDLLISVLAPAFDVDLAIGGQEIPGVNTIRRVTVDPNADCEPVIFFLTPVEGCEAGTKRISVEFSQNKKKRGSLGFDVELVAGPVAAEDVKNAVKPDFALGTRCSTVKETANATDPDAAELNLRVVLEGRTLSYFLSSKDEKYRDTPLGKVELETDPQAFFAAVTQQLSLLAAQPFGPDDGRTLQERQQAEEDSVAQLHALGVRLWNLLIPAPFQQVYVNDLRRNYAGKSLVITSDEPWIPWEMVEPKAKDTQGMPFRDPPLCEQFRLTRWLNGPAAPERLDVKRGFLVAPDDNLEAVTKEVAFFSGLRWTTQIRTRREVIQEFLNGSAQLFHFSCHGLAGIGGADEPALKLADERLVPSYVEGQLVRLDLCKPLVFLNACEAGQGGFTLTGLGGWARTFIDLQASIFIGSLWAINDQLAAAFAQSFYNRLWGLNGQTQQSVGAAFHAARQDIKAMAPGNPTWLAYVLYGDPNGRVYINA